MMNKFIYIFLNALPILLMVALIPVVGNDYILSLIYIGLILISLVIKKEPKDIFVFFFGFTTLTISEVMFINTGVETFNRNSLFGLMPIWLPILWGYGFIAIKRGVLAL